MTDDQAGPSVFLSHAKLDKGVVMDFYQLLGLDGFRPWLDAVDLVVGHDWELEVRTAVKRADAVAVFLSQHSVDHRGFVQSEISLALDIAEREPEGFIFVLPVRLDGAAVPARLSHLHWLDRAEPTPFIGCLYVGLQRALVSRAFQLRRARAAGATAAETSQGGMGTVFESRSRDMDRLAGMKMAAFGYEAENAWTGGNYLVRGVNPDGGHYTGIASLEVKRAKARLVSQIGTTIFRYSGTFDGHGLTVSGPHFVQYHCTALEGVLMGTWDAGGFEELIPVSQFARVPDALRASD